jgi:hypothetical protein
MKRILLFLSVVLVVMVMSLSPPMKEKKGELTKDTNTIMTSALSAKHGPDPAINGLLSDKAMTTVTASSQMVAIGNIAPADYSAKEGLVKSNLTFPS